MGWEVKGSDLIEFFKSGAYREMERKIALMGQLFEDAPRDLKTECSEQLGVLARRNKEREQLRDQGRLEEEDFDNQQKRETEEFAATLLRWFPDAEFASAPTEELFFYALALKDYHLRKSRVN